MELNSSSEQFWKHVKFLLIFIISASLVYIGLTKYMIKIPGSDNIELLAAIAEFEIALEKQAEIVEEAKKIQQEISEMEFDIHQIQKQDEIKRKIFKIETVHKEHILSSKYTFSVQVAKILTMLFDYRREHSSLLYNKELVQNNLNECQANI